MTRRPALLLAVLALALAAAPASAAERSATRDGMTLTVSKGVGLAPEGERVRVRGSGYDPGKGIYVAFCVAPPAGQQPTPCGGGADTEGRSGNSVWISDLPPAYGIGLAQAYGPGGTFDVEISVRAALNEDVDCREVQCAVVTRADHTRSGDRSLDVIVPVSFATPAGTPAPAQAAPAPGAPAAAPARAPRAAAAPAAPAAQAAEGTEAAEAAEAEAVEAPVEAPALPLEGGAEPLVEEAGPLAGEQAPSAPVESAPLRAEASGGPLLPVALGGALALAAGAATVLVRRRLRRPAA